MARGALAHARARGGGNPNPNRDPNPNPNLDRDPNQERARSEARLTSLPLSALAEEGGFMPKVPADSDDVPAEWRTSGVPGDVARLSLLAEAIEEYIAASQVCEAAQDDLP